MNSKIYSINEELIQKKIGDCNKFFTKHTEVSRIDDKNDKKISENSILIEPEEQVIADEHPLELNDGVATPDARKFKSKDAVETRNRTSMLDASRMSQFSPKYKDTEYMIATEEGMNLMIDNRFDTRTTKPIDSFKSDIILSPLSGETVKLIDPKYRDEKQRASIFYNKFKYNEEIMNPIPEGDAERLEETEKIETGNFMNTLLSKEIDSPENVNTNKMHNISRDTLIPSINPSISFNKNIIKGESFGNKDIQTTIKSKENRIQFQVSNSDSKNGIANSQITHRDSAHIHTQFTQREDITERIAPEEDFFYDFYQNDDINIGELINSLTLCHQARTKYEGDDYLYESKSQEEISLLKFAKACGKTFEKSNRFDNPTLYTVREKNDRKLYKILGINEFSYKRRRFSVVLKNSNSESGRATVFVKGPDYSMKNSLNLDEQESENYDKIVEKFHQQGLKIIVFAKRVLNETETLDFSTRYQNLKGSLYSQGDQLEELASKIESKLELLSIIGLKDDIRPGAIECIQSLKESNIKVWMVTGDTQENAVNVANTTKIICPNKTLYTLTTTKFDETKLMLRNILSQIRKSVEGDFNEILEPMMKKVSINAKMSISDKAKEIFNNSLTISGETLD